MTNKCCRWIAFINFDGDFLGSKLALWHKMKRNYPGLNFDGTMENLFLGLQQVTVTLFVVSVTAVYTSTQSMYSQGTVCSFPLCRLRLSSYHQYLQFSTRIDIINSFVLHVSIKPTLLVRLQVPLGQCHFSESVQLQYYERRIRTIL